MAHAADREIWLNFLDEVDEYLNTIESGLIGLAEKGVNSQQMDAALRAVHTIKGIGSMIECPAMTALAHRFEDSLKIIKARRSSVQVDAPLELLLLQGLDSLRQISSLHRQALPITDGWLQDYVHPIFEKLHSRLGDIQPSDELALLADESDDDTAVVMFGTEVEELLDRLATVLDTPGLPCLREELEMMVEELQDLGKMLQIEAFTTLCQSIHQQLVAAPSHHIEPIARESLELWQRSQALVMVGKMDKLPTRLELSLAPPLEEENDWDDNLELETSLELGDDLTSLFSPSTQSDTSIPNFDVFLADASEGVDALEDAEIIDADSATLSPGTAETPPDEDMAEELPEIDITIDSEIVNGFEDLDLENITLESAEMNGFSAFVTADDPIAGQPLANETNSSVDGAGALGDDIPGEQGTVDIPLEADEQLESPAVEEPFTEGFETVNFTGLEAAIENFNPADFELEAPEEAAPEPPPTVENEATVEPIAEDISFEPQITSSPSRPRARSHESEEFVELHVEPVEPTNQTQELQENTVRVPIKLLNQLNDLFGELIIQRNTMNSRLDQMEDLMDLFAKRMGNLETTNTELQAFCNQLAVDTSAPTLGKRGGDNLLPPSAAANVFSESGLGEAKSTQMFTSATDQTFDSLELDRYSDLHLLSQDQRETLLQLREVSSDVKLNMRDIKQASSNLNRTAKSLQINVTRARMRPLSDIVERFPRTVRELSLQYGKTVNLKISGGATLIDRFVAVHLRDPLMHLLRNAFDHGIETADVRQAQGKSAQGTIEIRAAHRGNQTLISVSDDGAGINLDKIRDRAYQVGLTDDILDTLSQSEMLGMIFEPGFSTAEQVTNLSGRGIGMDVVRNNLEQIRSEIKVDTQPGMGTTFTISVPFTLSILRVLLVESGGMRLAFPTDSVEEMIRLHSVQIFDSPEQKVINWEGLTVPLIHLDQWLEFRGPLRTTKIEAPPIISEPSILIVRRDDRLTGIYIDRFWGEREVVIRQVENVISLPVGFSGCTILEDGHVVPLADAAKLLEWIDRGNETDPGNNHPQRWQNLLHGIDDDEPTQPLALPQAQQINIMVVDDSINMRQLLRTTLEQAGYGVEQGKDGQDAVDQLMGGLPVDAVVCDIEMPRLDGYGVLAEIKADPQLKDLPIIMLTSRGNDKHRQLAMRLGATAYITKPYQDHELLQMLDQVIQQQPAISVR